VGITIRNFQVFVARFSPFETGKAAEGGSSPNVSHEQQSWWTFIFDSGRTYQKSRKHVFLFTAI
jgi:hypothetical protein